MACRFHRGMTLVSHSSWARLGVRGVDAIIHRGDEYDVAGALIGDRDMGDIERLRVDLAIDRERE